MVYKDIRKKLPNGKVLVAMSGGVDSSVSAALLIEQGYRVEGVFIITWTAPWLDCTWRQERRDAMRVAASLKMPFHTIDLSKEYERDVVNYLVSEYSKGRTPNPDVMCNKHIKFGELFTWATSHGFEFLATGHYARNELDITNGIHKLCVGLDRNKDQSYFLWTITQKHLEHTLFPIGGFEKNDVRELARHYRLHIADKRDSQGVCFLGKIDMREFLSHYIDAKPGDVFDTNGKIIGEHNGAVFYTLGQRHGFYAKPTSPNMEPLYVISKDVEKNTITVAPFSYSKPVVETQVVRLSSVNWIQGTIPKMGLDLHARLRYRQKLFSVSLREASQDDATLEFKQPQKYVPEGQSLVLYDGEECLGGGVI